MTSPACIIKCEDYLEDKVHSAVSKIFDLLKLHQIIKPGQKVLLKPNLLMNLPPERGATTHPAVVGAVAKAVKALGAIPLVGDSPGGINVAYEKVIKETGMSGIDAEIVNFDEKGMRKFDNPGKKIDPIYISNVALDADVIINIPKLKTHELTLMTCGIKNMFGVVPGFHKISYHCSAITREDFSEALIDLYENVKPAITIVDAITAMEGQGPSNGKLVNMGLMVASRDTVSVDAVCSKLIGYEPFDIPTTRIAHKRGLGEGRLENIEILGEPLRPIAGFEHPSGSLSILNKMPYIIRLLLKPITTSITLRPYINRGKCVKCGMCVSSCPAKAIDPATFHIDKNKCIMCFCCRELCKYGAVELKENLLWKIFNQIKKHQT